VGILNIFVSGVFSSILNIGSTILNLMVVYYVITTTGNLGHSIGNQELEAKGKTVWTLYLICAIASVVITLVSLIPLLGTLVGAVLAVVMAVVQIVAYILYLIFLYKGSQALA
jgi:TRAP-type C4-dicarboxylate transport system permease small subunit